MYFGEAVKTSDRLSDFTSFIVMDIMERALELERQGVDVVHMEIGEPDFSTPPPVEEAMARALKDGKTHYTHSLGIRELREAIAWRYMDKYGVDVSPERVCVTTGTSAGFLMVFGLLLEFGDVVAMSDPGYPCYPNFVRFVGGRPLPIPIEEADGFQLTPEKIRAQNLTGVKVFIISSPANPTGTLTSRETFLWVIEHGYTLISDEIYHDLVYTEDREYTGLEFSDDVIVVDGFSKRYAMTGCRLGWVVVPERLVRQMHQLAQNLYICPPTVSQWGGVAAIREAAGYVEQVRLEYKRRRRVLIDGLKTLGFKVGFEPQAAFYVFADISSFSNDSFDFCRRMLAEAHVAATPGIDFGRHNTHRYVRFAFTQSVDEIEEGLHRLNSWL